jgi:molecular chaperone Hsp33
MDQFRRFLLEDLDIRGIVVRLGPAWRAMLQGRSYAPPVARTLGEMCAITVAIGGQMKSDGRLTFQLRGAGPIQRLVIDCESGHGPLRLRGMATANNVVADQPAAVLLSHGQLVMTLDLPEARQPFQSTVPIEGQRVSDIFEQYISRSEQQPTRIVLAADEHHAAALFVQKLPDADRKDADGWTRVQHLIETVKTAELLDLDGETLLSRVFHEEAVRVFTPRGVAYHCPEDWAKIHSMLRSLGRDELQAILDEHGEILVRDDICNREYRLGPSEVEAMLAAKVDGQTLH